MPKLWSYIAASDCVHWTVADEEVVTLCLARSQFAPLDISLKPDWSDRPDQISIIDTIMGKAVQHSHRWRAAQLRVFAPFPWMEALLKPAPELTHFSLYASTTLLGGPLDGHVSPGRTEVATTRC